MKKLLTLSLTLLFFVAFTKSANAVTVESQSDKSNLVQTFVITSSPKQISTALKLRLTVTGGKITSFTPGSDGVLSIGTCDTNNVAYTTTQVCTDLATVSSNFEAGQVLGVLVIERDDQYTQLKITKESENAYLNRDGELVEDSGVAFSLYGGGTTTTTTDSTKSDLTNLFFLLVTFLTGTVFGTTLTTLGHVLQNNKRQKK